MGSPDRLNNQDNLAIKVRKAAIRTAITRLMTDSRRSRIRSPVRPRITAIQAVTTARRVSIILSQCRNHRKTMVSRTGVTSRQ